MPSDRPHLTAQDLDTRLLRSFLAVVRTGSFTSAASALELSQQAVSGQMKRLEAVLERPLFERTATGIHLTEHAHDLIAPAEVVVEQTQSLFDAVRGQTQPIRVAEIRSRRMMQQISVAHRARFPHHSTTIEDFIGDEQIRAVIAKELDVAMYHVRTPLDGIRTLPLRFDPLMVLHVQRQESPTLRHSRLGVALGSPGRYQAWGHYLSHLAEAFDVEFQKNMLDITLLEAIGQGQIRGDIDPILALEGMQEYPAADDFHFALLSDVQPYYVWSLAWRADERRTEVLEFVETARAVARQQGWLTLLDRTVPAWFPPYGETQDGPPTD